MAPACTRLKSRPRTLRIKSEDLIPHPYPHRLSSEDDTSAYLHFIGIPGSGLPSVVRIWK